MANQGTIEKRLEAVEAAVAELKKKVERPTGKPGWLKRMRGSMKGLKGFDKVVEYGRQFRQADRPSIEGEGL